MRRWLTTVLLGGTLVVNYVGHRTGWWTTICTNTRSRITFRQFLVGWTLLTAFMVPHIRHGYPKRP
jgi:hypothetical protein